MIESLLAELPQHNGHDHEQAVQASDAVAEPSAEKSLLAALPIVQRIVGRRASQRDSTNRSDLVQEVALRLWRWTTNYREKSEKMSGTEWNSFAARAAYNEVNRQLSRENSSANVPLESVSEFEALSIEGHTDIEVFSLIHKVWQEICKLSLRQRRSLLLHSQELIIYFLQSGITEKELAGVLEFTDADWNDVLNRVPMTDAEIAGGIEHAGRKVGSTATPGSIKKARYEARAKLEGSIRK